MREICPVCGCREIVCLNKATHTYYCKACDEKFDLTEKPPVERIIEKVIVEKSAEKDGLTPAEIYKKAIGSVVELKCCFGEDLICGTGFYISNDGYIVTNCHLMITRNEDKKLSLCEEICIFSNEAQDEIKLKLVFIDPKNDLALLKDERGNCKPLRIAGNTPEIGDSVVAIGNSKGQGLSIVNGIVSDLDREFNGHPAFLFNALVAEGCSGGPVLNKNCEVCGVTVGGRNDAAGMKYAIPLDTLIKFIKIAETEKEIKIKLE